MLLYISATNQVVSVVLIVERGEEGHKFPTQKPVYYVSEVLTPCKSRYPHVTPRIRCARCPPVIHRRCHVICLRVAFCHVIICISYHIIMCISLCIHVRFMHPSFFPVVRFAIRHSYVPRRPLLPLFVCGC